MLLVVSSELHSTAFAHVTHAYKALYHHWHAIIPRDGFVYYLNYVHFMYTVFQMTSEHLYQVLQDNVYNMRASFVEPSFDEFNN